jgi:hypothetical protein
MTIRFRCLLFVLPFTKRVEDDGTRHRGHRN